MNESRRQIQSLTCEVDGLKGVVRARECFGGLCKAQTPPGPFCSPFSPAERGAAAADAGDGG